MPTIAILGAGIFAREAYLPALKALGDSVPHLSAVYSRSQKSAEELAAAAKEQLGLSDSLAVYHEADPKSNLDALLARPDIIAVIIALPITTQPSIILKALAAGKHVLSEKPVAADVASGLKLIETYRSTYESKGLVWRVAENFEAEPGYRAAGEAVQQGKIGKVNFFKATVTNYIDTTSKWYNTAWRTVPDYQGGFVLDGGVHTIAALRTILPEPFTHLSAFASLNKEILKPIDTIHVIIKAGQHFHGVIDMTWASPTPSTPDSYELVITGTQGYITVKNVTIDGKTIRRVVIKSIKAVDGNLGEDEEKVIDEAHKGIEVEVKSFLAAVDKRDTLAIGDPLKALGDVAVIQAALNSDGSLIDIQSLLQKGH